jgi:hypothetical protein
VLSLHTTSPANMQHMPNFPEHTLLQGHAVHPGALVYFTHAAFAQYSSGAHANPHPPQLLRSTFVFTHPAGPVSGPHRILSVGHAVATEHVPPMQYSPTPHVVPHAPQFTMSLSKSLHPRQPGPPHAPKPGTHFGVPPMQTSPWQTAFPHVPQLCGSVARSTHLAAPVVGSTHDVPVVHAGASVPVESPGPMPSALASPGVPSTNVESVGGPPVSTIAESPLLESPPCAVSPFPDPESPPFPDATSKFDELHATSPRTQSHARRREEESIVASVAHPRAPPRTTMCARVGTDVRQMLSAPVRSRYASFAR